MMSHLLPVGYMCYCNMVHQHDMCCVNYKCTFNTFSRELLEKSSAAFPDDRRDPIRPKVMENALSPHQRDQRSR